eukprot:COSAG06_NODE_45957_length_350_cov_13.709163_2_plen_35_part_01
MHTANDATKRAAEARPPPLTAHRRSPPPTMATAAL